MGLLTLALILDWLIGDPDWLWRRLRHPVVLIGGIIDAWEARIRAAQASDRALFWGGLALVAVLFLLAAGVSILVYALAALNTPLGLLIELAIVFILIAQRSLYDHVRRVADALRRDGLEAGRRAVAMIVGRDVTQLETSGVSKAAVESLAENLSDGVIAPVFWYAIGGLPGVIFYKAVNTADSMIGHRTAEYEQFGKAAAVLDDILNWLPARLTAWFVACAGLVEGRAVSDTWQIVRRDAPTHRSPNAGWPEAAFAAVLGLSLGGPRAYGKDRVDGAVLNASGRQEASAYDIDRALALMVRTCGLLFVFVFGVWVFFV